MRKAGRTAALSVADRRRVGRGSKPIPTFEFILLHFGFSLPKVTCELGLEGEIAYEADK